MKFKKYLIKAYGRDFDINVSIMVRLVGSVGYGELKKVIGIYI